MRMFLEARYEENEMESSINSIYIFHSHLIIRFNVKLSQNR